MKRPACVLRFGTVRFVRLASPFILDGQRLPLHRSRVASVGGVWPCLFALEAPRARGGAFVRGGGYGEGRRGVWPGSGRLGAITRKWGDSPQ